MSQFITAYRFLESAIRELERIGDKQAEDIIKQLKQPKRDLEDIIW